MATTTENSLRIDNIVNNAVYVSDLSGAEKRELIEALFPNGVAINVNDPNIKVGDNVYGEKAGINSGKWFFGTVLTAPPTNDSHIDFDYEKI
mgnify:CR=1 FL=1